jgi:hypothetical protein
MPNTVEGRRSRKSRWVVMAAGGFVVLALILAVVLIRNWPFTQSAITQDLEQESLTNVTMGSFHETVAPPGFVAEDVNFTARGSRAGAPPLVHLRKLTVVGSYAALLTLQRHVSKMQLEGLHVTVPPPGSLPSPAPFSKSAGTVSSVGEVTADGALLEMLPQQPGDAAFKLAIRSLVLDHVSTKSSLTFRVAVTNTNPPGEIQASGRLGPWHSRNPLKTPVSGEYSYSNVNLGFYTNVDGRLQSSGKFSGDLGHISTSGTADVPEFHVDGSQHTSHLSTSFRAVVNAGNGDVSLPETISHFGHSTILAKGDVTSAGNDGAKTVKLDVNSDQSRVEDLLNFFTSEAHPSMIGAVRFRAKVEIPPGDGFLKRVQLTGEFGISGARLTNPAVQVPIDRLSESVKESGKQIDADKSIVLSDIKGHVASKDGIATLSQVSFTFPGSYTELSGTFNLVTKALDIHGVLRTDGKIPDAASGLKSLLLRGVTRLLKKKDGITIVPFTIKGTASHPDFDLDLEHKTRA